MLNKTKYLLIFILFPLCALLAEEKVIDALHNVDLVSTEKFNNQGIQFGVDYFAVNQNDFRVYITIKSVDAQNVYQGLVPGQSIIDAGERVHLGWMVHSDFSRDANWEVEWEVEVGEKAQAANL